MSEKVIGGAGASDMDLNRKFEGILSKFTNLVKGYQPRIFVLDPDTGSLSYYLLDDSGRKDKLRGSQPLGGSICTPSEEDENTFHINFASGEQWKVKAISAKERQQWVNRIRACAYSESVVNSHVRENKPATPPGSKSHFTNGEPSKELQTLSLSVRDAFGSVHTCLNNLEREQRVISDTIEGLPLRKSPGSGISPTCHDKELLQLKATSAATLRCVEDALSVLQVLKGTELEPPVVIHHATIPLPTAFNQTTVNLTLPGSPAHRSVSSLSIPTTPSRGSGGGGRPRSADIMRISQH